MDYAGFPPMEKFTGCGMQGTGDRVEDKWRLGTEMLAM